jgi:DNA-binding transcriptional LysR family regulator
LVNTRFLETFVWLSRLRSFSRTAEKLHSSQPAISGRIAALEDALGVTLYDRQVRGFELTPAGHRILARCTEIVELTSELRALAQGGNTLGRAIRIGVSDVVGMTWLSDFRDRLASDFSDFGFDITTDSAPNLAAALIDDAIDLAFVASGVEHPRIVNAPLCNYRVCWVANPRHFDVERDWTVDGLCDLPIIMPPHGTPGYIWQTEYLKRHSEDYARRARRQINISCGFSPATGIEMVEQGFGVLPLPVLLVRDAMAAGSVALMKVREPFPAWHIAACSKSPPPIPAITTLVETAQAVAKAYADRVGGNDFWP